MKRVFLFAIAMVALTSCEKVNIKEIINEQQQEEVGLPKKTFTFHVKGDFLTCYEDMTRASVRLEENNTAAITDLWVLDYVDGVRVQEVHQTPADADFGHPQMDLTYGHHDIKFIASKGETPSLTTGALSWGKVKDTFVLDYPVDVVASSNGNRAPELKRAIAGVKVTITDEIPADAKTMCITLGSRSQTLTLPSLSALPYSESTAELDVSSVAGQSGKSVAIYTLAGDEEWTSTASITVKDASNKVITSFTLPDVTLKRNRMTVLTGEVFNRTSGFSVSIDDSWDEGLNSTF